MTPLGQQLGMNGAQWRNQPTGSGRYHLIVGSSLYLVTTKKKVV